MRKALLALAMVAASFAGGAVVNGPGLDWARAALQSDPPVDDASDAVPVLDDALARAQPEADVPRDGAAAEPSPLPPLPEPQADANPAPPALSPTPPEPSPTPTSVEVPAPPPPTAPAPAPVEAWGDAPGSAPAAAVPPPPRDGPARLDATIAPAALAPPAPLAGPSPSPTPEGGRDEAANDSGLEIRNPKSRVAKTESRIPNLSVPPLARAEGGAWAELARRMKELGVSRYWVEGEPGGPVRFRCVVPLPGQTTVGQQFEAEADDAAGAADIALRRIALWKATEPK